MIFQPSLLNQKGMFCDSAPFGTVIIITVIIIIIIIITTAIIIVIIGVSNHRDAKFVWW